MNIENSDFFKGIGFYKKLIKENKNLKFNFSQKYNECEKLKNKTLDLESQIEFKNDIIKSLYNKIEDNESKIKDFEKLESNLEAVKRALESYRFKDLQDNGYVYFNGIDNCEEDCEGWDGQDDRCECGNQRVCWVYDDNYLKYPNPYAH